MLFFLGTEVARSKQEVVLSQQKYIQYLFTTTSMLEVKPAGLPMDKNIVLDESSSLEFEDTKM